MKSSKYTKETITHVGVIERNFPSIAPGNTVIVSQRIKEGDKERIQLFEGDVIAIKKRGASTTFTVRRIGAHGIGVERIFPLHSPLIKSIEVVRTSSVRRAKLYYVRGRVGKAARLKEHIKKVVAPEQEQMPSNQENVV